MTDPPIELIETWIQDAIDMIQEGVISAEAMPFHIACCAAEWGYSKARGELS